MNLDKISDDRLFQNNSKEELKHWCTALRYFHYLRARGGHNCEGDSFCVYFKYNGRDDLYNKLKLIGVLLKPLEDGFISFDPQKSYSLDDLDKLKVTILEYPDFEQPQHTEIFGFKAHVWVLTDRFEISVSGNKDGKTYKVSDSDFNVCMSLEKQFDKIGWETILDNDIKSQIHCISKEKYPELYI